MAVKLKWDTKSSTYFWNITLDENNPVNTISIMSGYSKVENQHENTDKETLLKRKIINLYINGYFKRSKRIDIFQNTGVFIDKKLDPCIITLYPTTFDIPKQNQELIFKKFGSFLIDFYDKINNNKSLDNILPTGRRIKSQDDFLNINSFNFKSPANLYAHASRLLINGHAEGAVNSFIQKYKELKQWK